MMRRTPTGSIINLLLQVFNKQINIHSWLSILFQAWKWQLKKKKLWYLMNKDIQWQINLVGSFHFRPWVLIPKTWISVSFIHLWCRINGNILCLSKTDKCSTWSLKKTHSQYRPKLLTCILFTLLSWFMRLLCWAFVFPLISRLSACVFQWLENLPYYNVHGGQTEAQWAPWWIRWRTPLLGCKEHKPHGPNLNKTHDKWSVDVKWRG